MMKFISNLAELKPRTGTKLDMFANITLTSIKQCMKFKLHYDDWVRVHPLKRSNQPIITLYNIQQQQQF
jgi:hypothetical protein